MNALRRRLALTAGVCFAIMASPALAAETALPLPHSLPQAAQAAAAQGEPLVLLVSLPGCPHCELVRRHYLAPARAQSGLPAWQINVRDSRSVIQGFDGQPSTPAAEARTRQAGFTPTVLFLGPEGQELAERLVGISPDFYGAYLEQRLDTARQALSRLPSQSGNKR